MSAAEKAQHEYDAIVEAFVAGRWGGPVSAAPLADREDAARYASSLGYAPATPDRRVVVLWKGCTLRVNPDPTAPQWDEPFDQDMGGGTWVKSIYHRELATPGTILGDLLARPNVGDVPPTLPPLPAITDEYRAMIRSFSGHLPSSEARHVCAYIATHAPRADGAA
jgi:hypothetical protein